MATSERKSVDDWHPQYLEGSFAKLYLAYGFDLSKQGSADYHGFGGLAKQNGINLSSRPMYFLRNGWTSIDGNAVESTNISGYVWSSTTYDQMSLSSHQQLSSLEIFPAGFGMRWYGESLREKDMEYVI